MIEKMKSKEECIHYMLRRYDEECIHYMLRRCDNKGNYQCEECFKIYNIKLNPDTIKLKEAKK